MPSNDIKLAEALKKPGFTKAYDDPYIKGYDAAQNNNSRVRSPYPVNSEGYRLWMRGWTDGSASRN